MLTIEDAKLIDEINDILEMDDFSEESIAEVAPLIEKLPERIQGDFAEIFHQTRTTFG